MIGGADRFSGGGGRTNEAILAQIRASRRRQVWRVVIGASVLSLLAAIAGCLLMMKTQGVKAAVAQMRDEIGETLTEMSLQGANEAVSTHLPKLINTTATWDRTFAARIEDFRGLDVEIDRAQAMHRLGAMAERWRRELEGIAPSQRGDYWAKNLKAQVEGEQKKWPNITHKRGMSEKARDLWLELWYGVKHGSIWPYGIYERTAELVKGGRGIDSLDIGDCLRYILFPYTLSGFTMLRLFGISVVTSVIGYLMCWMGLKSRFGVLSYVGLAYFLYLINIAFFIGWLEITK